MKILLLGHRDVASNIALSLIAKALPEHRFDVRLSGAVALRGEPPMALRELSAYEERLCDALPQMAGAKRAGVTSFEEIAARSGGTFGELPAPNAPEGLEALAACGPDLVISVRYRRILRAEAIAVPRRGVLNLHSGLLPEYKGMMATFWAMLNGERTIGSTLHFIVDAGIDTGPIVGRAPLPMDREKTYLANVLALYPPGCAMVAAAVRRLECGELRTATAQTAKGHYYSAPATPDIARFEAIGHRLYESSDLPDFLGKLT